MAKSKKTASTLMNLMRRRGKNSAKLHRSFRHTARRDAIRALELPGYFSFTSEVLRLLLENRRLFFSLVILYAFLIVIFGGISNQDVYGQISEFIGSESVSPIGVVGQAGLAALLGIGGGGAGISDIQQVYLVLAVLLVWLSTVWLMREVMAGRKPKLRDGVYSSGAPIVATALLTILLLVQLLPLGILAIIYGGLAQVGLATEGLGAMLFFMITALTAALCLYWASATFIALVTVTLPGMYPLRALRLAKDVVYGRRLRIMYRIIWLIVVAAVAALVALIPVILLDQWLRTLADWVAFIPIVPAASALVSAAVAVFSASYVYSLYRKVVAYDAEASR